MSNMNDVFGQLASHDAAMQKHDQAITPVTQQSGMAGIFDQLAKGEGKMPESNPAAQEGAYQQAKGGPIRNVNTDGFTDTTTSMLGKTGAIMKRPEESDSQLLARTKNAASQVTPQQIGNEQSEAGRLAGPTAGAAYLGGATAGMAPEAGAALSGKGVEALKSLAGTDGGKEALKWIMRGVLQGAGFHGISKLLDHF